MGISLTSLKGEALIVSFGKSTRLLSSNSGEQKDKKWNKAKLRDNLFYFENISKGKQTSNHRT